MGLMFDHEKLEVYQLELRFVTWVTPFLADVKKAGGALVREACDHLDRGSLSALFNTAEGNGKRQRQVRAKFFDDARGSAGECAACLDALVAKGACPAQQVSEGKEMLVRIAQMLAKLVQRYSASDRVREDELEYGVRGIDEDKGEEEFENDDDDEDDDD